MRGDELYLHGFWELSSCRQFGEVLGPIPWNRIVDYSILKGLDLAMMNVFEHVIRELDEAYLKWQRDRQNKTTQK